MISTLLPHMLGATRAVRCLGEREEEIQIQTLGAVRGELVPERVRFETERPVKFERALEALREICAGSGATLVVVSARKPEPNLPPRACVEIYAEKDLVIKGILLVDGNFVSFISHS